MRKFIIFLNNVNKETNGKFFMISMFVLLIIVTTVMLLTGTQIVPENSNHFAAVIAMNFMVNFFFGILLMIAIKVIKDFYIWIVNELIPAFKVAAEKSYNYKEKEKSKVKFNKSKIEFS